MRRARESRVRRARAWLFAVLAIAATARIAAYQAPLTVPPDGYSYLNLARQLRGVSTLREWDSCANLPRDDQGARTPGYPVFLNLVFWATGWRPSPTDVVNAVSACFRVDPIGWRPLPPGDPWHVRFAATEENLKAVQAAQHLLGLFATVGVYLIVMRWTDRPVLAALTATLAVGLRPAWILAYERYVLTEVLAAALLIGCVWAVSRAETSSRTTAWATILAIFVAVGILVRPSVAFAAPAAIVGLVWMHRRRGFATVAVVGSVCLVLVGGWVVRNGTTYGFWGLSPVLDLTLPSLMTSAPEAFEDPEIRELAWRYRTPQAGVFMVAALMDRHGLTLNEASKSIGRHTIRAAAGHPQVYLFTALKGFQHFWYPAEAGTWSPASSLVRLGWRVVLVAYLLLQMIGLFAVAVPRPRAVKVSLAMVLLSAGGISFVNFTETIRFAFPFGALLLMCAAVVVHQALDAAARWRA